jgi:GWxTD domain-containing protein
MKTFTTLLLAMIILGHSFDSDAKNVRAYLNYVIFKSPENGPYIETYLSVSGESVVYKLNEKNLYQAAIEVTFIFKKDENIHDFDKYVLFSPELEDTSSIAFNFLDQQRYFIPEGNYDLEIIISDRNAGKKPYTAIQPVSIWFEKDKPNFSGIELIESVSLAEDESIVTKSGYNIIPLVHNFYPATNNKLSFYAELYELEDYLGADDKFLCSCSIISFETGIALKDYTSYQRMDAKNIIPILKEYDITSLPSGNYKLQIEARDKENNLIAATHLFFQRSNPDISFSVDQLASVNVENTFAGQINSADTLDEFIRCLAPRATELEKTFIYKQLENADMRTKQQFLYNFWQTRNPADPLGEWMEYYELVIIVNAAYKTQIHKGYETDRGRVYLQYGPPNIISESYNEPSSYPFEIWQYYQLPGGQRNKRFVFYTTDLITNSFKLLHSDAIGEVYNHKWKVFLNNRWFDPFNVDQEDVPEIWGGNVDDYYRNPR